MDKDDPMLMRNHLCAGPHFTILNEIVSPSLQQRISLNCDPSRVWWLQFGDPPATWRQTYVSVGPFGKSGKVTARLEVEAGRPYKPVDFDEGIVTGRQVFCSLRILTPSGCY